MTARLAAALDKFQRLAQGLNHGNPALRTLIERAFFSDLDRASAAIERIEKEHDKGLAAMA